MEYTPGTTTPITIPGQDTPDTTPKGTGITPGTPIPQNQKYTQYNNFLREIAAYLNLPESVVQGGTRETY